MEDYEHKQQEVEKVATVEAVHSSDDGHDHGGAEKEQPGWKTHWDLLLALFILIVLLVLEYGFTL